MRQTVLGLLAVLGMTGAAHAEILTLFSDKGFYTNNVFAGPGSASFFGNDSTIAAAEGFTSWKTQQPTIQGAFWGYTFPSFTNLSRFNSGELRFWVNSPNGNVRVEIKKSGGTVVLSKTLASLGWTNANINQWVLLRAPLVGVDLTSVDVGFDFAFNNGPLTYYVDDVRYVDSTALPIFNTTLYNIANNTVTSPQKVTWTLPPLPTGWVRADQYLQLDVDINSISWGVQLYTDNTAADAVPKFVSPVASGQPGSNPAGLIDSATKGHPLPMAWAIVASSVSAAPVATDPNDSSQSVNSFPWSYVSDHGTPAIPGENTLAFVDGSIGSTIKNNQGIHYGHNDFAIGAEPPTNTLYLEANFSAALQPNVYQTSKLILELFTL
jgi:hypothetical protein